MGYVRQGNNRQVESPPEPGCCFHRGSHKTNQYRKRPWLTPEVGRAVNWTGEPRSSSGVRQSLWFSSFPRSYCREDNEGIVFPMLLNTSIGILFSQTLNAS